jgi:predicted MFS family arabinose efflux permease
MTATQNNFLFPKAKKDSMLVRVLISFLTTAGLFYINIMPALIDGFKQALHFSNQQAGFISSVNAYGTAVGAFAVIFYIKKINWRITVALLLLALIAIDLSCIKITNPDVLAMVRFLHGCVGGSLVGIGFAVTARTKDSDKTFGVLLVVQFGLGGLGMMYIPQLVPHYGIAVLYLSLVAFSLVTLLMLPFISDYKLGKDVKKLVPSSWKLLSQRPLQYTLSSIFLFQAANMGLYAFIFELGKHYGLSVEFLSVSLAWAAWIAILGPVLVIWMSTRFGLFKPLAFGIFFTIIGTIILLYSDIKMIWIIANIGVGITWAFVNPYLFSICARLDENGQVAAMGSVASKLGLATGPAVVGLMLANDNYSLVIIIASVVLFISLITSLMAAKLVD